MDAPDLSTRPATAFRAVFLLLAVLVLAAIAYTGWLVFRYWAYVTV